MCSKPFNTMADTQVNTLTKSARGQCTPLFTVAMRLATFESFCLQRNNSCNQLSFCLQADWNSWNSATCLQYLVPTHSFSGVAQDLGTWKYLALYSQSTDCCIAVSVCDTYLIGNVLLNVSRRTLLLNHNTGQQIFCFVLFILIFWCFFMFLVCWARKWPKFFRSVSRFYVICEFLFFGNNTFFLGCNMI